MAGAVPAQAFKFRHGVGGVKGDQEGRKPGQWAELDLKSLSFGQFHEKIGN